MAERKWELTPEEILAEGWAALDEWDDKHKASDFPTPDDAAKSWQTLLARAIANAAVEKFIDYINSHSSDEAQAWGSPAYHKCIALPVWKKVEQEVGL